MLYNFVDTIDKVQSGSSLPTEAMNYDGVFLENEIDGYRTLTVTGRELLGSEARTKDITGIDGTTWQGKSYSPRTIVVKYLLKTNTDAEFRKAYNKMNKLLSGEQVKIYFNDERDKYFVGSKISNDEVDGGTNMVIGEIEIYCADPFKYSTILKEFTTNSNEITVTNNGSVPATIDYEILNNSETGYIGIVSDGGVIQLGKIEELDSETYQESEQLADIDDFFNCYDDIYGTDVMHPQYGANGTCVEQNWFDQKFLGFGSVGTKKGNASGGLRTLVLPADSNGKRGAKNFYCYFHIILWASLMGQTGEMCINFLTEDNQLICGCNWYKTDAVGNTAHYEIYANGKLLKDWNYTASHLQSQNPWYWNWGHCDILKEGGNIRFYYYGSYYNYYIPEVENMECTKIQVAFKQWGDRNGRQMLHMMGFDVINFTKNNVSKWKDIPNRYSTGTTITIDGKTSHVYVNGMYKPGEEVIGSTYFKAMPGDNTIKFYQSSFTKMNPTIKVRIREAWI